MPFSYITPPNSGPLRQGELLRSIWEHRPLNPPVEIPQGSLVDVNSVYHPLMIVMTADCDLYQDFGVRFPDQQAKDQYQPGIQDENSPALVQHVLLSDLYSFDEIRPRIQGSDLWRRIRQNQDERYHRLNAADIGNPPVGQLPELYLDFKKALALPTESLYEGLRTKSIERVAIVSPIFIHDLIQRFYGFLSRVSLPD